jgi:hypothetical protein
MTRAFTKLTDLKNAATLAISLLSNLDNEECDGNIFSETFDKYHCKNCYNGIRSFLKLPNLKQIFKKTYQGPICSSTLENDAAQEMVIKTDADPNSISSPNISSENFNKNKADQSKILAIKAELRHSLLSIASKLLKSEDTRLHHLTSTEQQLWNSFEKADIYEFLTGEKDTIPEFQFNWISPEAPSLRVVPGASATAAAQLPPPVVVQLQAQPAPAQPAAAQHPPPVVDQAQTPLDPAQPAAPQPPPALNDQLPGQPDPAPQPQPSGSDRHLRDRKPIHYHELNTGIKKKCKSLRRKAKAVVTKLAPGALSPQPACPPQEKT